MSLERLSFLTDRGPLRYLHGAPTRATPATPLLVFLHGGRDRGDDPNLLLRWSPPKHVSELVPRPYRFIAPQLPADAAWTDHPDDLLGLVEAIVAEHGVDPDRVVLSGFSLGAGAAWQLASDHPGRFAGLAVASGRVPTGLSIDTLARLPTWVFHGGLDDKLPAADVERHVAALRLAGGHVDFTLYPQDNHFISEQAFASTAFDAWVAARHRSTARQAVAA